MAILRLRSGTTLSALSNHPSAQGTGINFNFGFGYLSRALIKLLVFEGASLTKGIRIIIHKMGIILALK